MNLSGIVKQLRKERDRAAQQVSQLDAALTAFVGVYKAKGRRATTITKRKPMSKAARRKIAAAQRARWAKVKRAA
jgi:hypothetical protein